jgi:type IV pilus biogenesis protein CpaD/CtpE
MKRISVVMATALVAGCANSPPVAPSKLKAPSAWMMESPCRATPIPADEANPASRSRYYASSRRCHARTADQVRGLQRYVRTVRQ